VAQLVVLFTQLQSNGLQKSWPGIVLLFHGERFGIRGFGGSERKPMLDFLFVPATLAKLIKQTGSNERLTFESFDGRFEFAVVELRPFFGW
jgi:hypothetical protein